ncbi:MAG: DEAD/DEAH box helicase [Bacteroidales bacterium]|nr:DEAD/DEAH box helicase [Bacteroidales bacterium]
MLKKWFDETWNMAAKDTIEIIENDNRVRKGVKQYFIENIKQLFRHYQPADIYYKILYEMFHGDINATLHDSQNKQIVRLEDSVIWNTLFDYQRKGVRSLINMLERYDGAVLADAVGLGKTFSALAVIKYFQNEGYFTVVLCPKKLEYNWLQYRRKNDSRFENDQLDYEVRFHTDLQDERLQHSYTEAKLDYLKSRPKLLLVIDESHNLRNDKSGRYKYLLEELLSTRSQSDIKVLELSATPINTNINDVRNQFKLFVRGEDSGFNIDEFGIPSLTELFREAQKKLNAWNENQDRKIADLVNSLPDKFFNLTDRLVVARTRKMIEKSEGKDLGFPTKNKPNNEYMGIKQIGQLTSFGEIYDTLLASNLTAYRPSSYTQHVKVKKVTEDQRARENFLVKMMLTLFLKRLESSWVACQTTVEKVLAQHLHALDKVEKFLSGEDRKATIDGEEDETILSETEEDGEDLTLGKKHPIRLADMVDIEEFKKDLENDIQALRRFTDNMSLYASQIESGEVLDDKLERLKAILTDKVNRSHKKVLIFTSYTDTANYLYRELEKVFPGRVASADGQGATYRGNREGNIQDTLRRFAPQSKMYKEYDWSRVYNAHYPSDTDRFDRSKNKWIVKYDEWKGIIHESDDPLAKECAKRLDEPVSILIATDCLSEGQNLQDAQTVINYDIHWNPVRIIQRVGRIDRIGSPNSSIDCYNFWPAADYESYLKLADRIERRMAMIALMGTETLALTEEIQRQLADNPIIDKNDSKLLSQLQESIDDTEAMADTFGLHDLSLETFRQDLLEYLGDKGEDLKNMPNGVFSGFKTVDTLFQDVPESIVALMGYPHKPDGALEHEYSELFLVLRAVNPERSEQNVKVFNRQEILAILSQNKNKKRNVPAAIDRHDKDAIAKLKVVLTGWIEEQVPRQNANIVGNLFSGDFRRITPEQEKLEQKFNPANMDLICWDYITK